MFAEKLTSLRTDISGLESLTLRDPFGNDTSLANERRVYNRDIAGIKTFLEMQGLTKLNDLYTGLKHNGNNASAEDLWQIIENAKNVLGDDAGLDANALYDKGKGLLKRGDYSQAVDYFDRAIKKSPTKDLLRRIYNKKGNTHIKRLR